MKTVILVRHGKASHDDLSVSDVQRPVTAEGRRRTKKIAKYLSARQTQIDKIITSPAVRAVETAKILGKELGIEEKDFLVEKKVYGAHPDTFYDILFALPDDLNHVMIVGHNPGIEMFAFQFLKMPVESLPTSGVVAIKFNTGDWTEVASCKSEVEFTVFPSMIK